MFITVEGIEGSGKSTLLAGLAERLRAQGSETIVTREPGGTALGDAIRKLVLEPTSHPTPLTEALLMNAARAQHVQEVIRPGLDRGAVVLCDRFVDSTIAYQGCGRHLEVSLLRSICDAATGTLVPDLTFVLDITVAQSRARVASRAQTLDRMESEDDAFHERVREGFLALARGSAHHRVLDGTRAPKELVDEAFEAVMALRGKCSAFAPQGSYRV